MKSAQIIYIKSLRQEIRIVINDIGAEQLQEIINIKMSI